MSAQRTHAHARPPPPGSRLASSISPRTFVRLGSWNGVYTQPELEGNTRSVNYPIKLLPSPLSLSLLYVHAETLDVCIEDEHIPLHSSLEHICQVMGGAFFKQEVLGWALRCQTIRAKVSLRNEMTSLGRDKSNKLTLLPGISFGMTS